MLEKDSDGAVIGAERNISPMLFVGFKYLERVFFLHLAFLHFCLFFFS